MVGKPTRWVTRYWVPVAVFVLALAGHSLIFGNALNPDTTSYMDETKTFLATGSLEIGSAPYARHPPMMSLVFVPFVLAFGYNEFSVHVLELAIFVGDLAGLYAVSLPLGSRLRIVPCVLLSFDPVLYLNMSEGRSLSLLILFALVVLWGIWRGLSESRWLSVAALGASLGFLTADTAGFLFLAAGITGFVWRYSYTGNKLFLDRGYLAAAALFLATVVGWTTYNLLATGSAYTDPRVVGFLDRLFFSTPVDVFVVTVGGLATYFFLYASSAAWPFLLNREGRAVLLRLPRLILDDQRIGALFLFIFVAASISATLAAAFLLYEPLRSLASVDSYLRYVSVIAPMVYLAIGFHVRGLVRGGHVMRWAFPLAITLILLSGQLATRVDQGTANSETFVEIRQLLDRNGDRVVYTDVVAFLEYNLPGIDFFSLYQGVSRPYINLTAAEVPVGSAILTIVYMPKTYDQRVGAFFFISNFDPSRHSPFINLAYAS